MKFFTSSGNLSILLAILTVISCAKDTLKYPTQIEGLVAVLQQGDFAQFYEAAAKEDLTALRSQFDKLDPEQRAPLNYGALLNAGIISDANKALFKPDIKKIDHYVNIPNDLKCWMNGALYSMANSAFFDEFLEIDHLLKDAWEKRPEANRAIANKVIRSLREIIYELRLGPYTTPERLAKARLRHLEALKALSELPVVASFYHELFASYDLEQIEFLNNKSVEHTARKQIPIDLAVLTKALAAHQPLRHLKGQGILGSIACNIENSSGFVDLAYSHGLFIMLDPWGSIARYLSASAKTDTADASLVTKLQDPYHNKLVFNGSVGTIHFFFNDWYFKNSVSVDLRDLASKQSLGKMIYMQRAADSASYRLVAKTRGSHNHLIAELYNFMRGQWETHSFFGPASFAPKESTAQTPYQDLTFYYLKQ